MYCVVFEYSTEFTHFVTKIANEIFDQRIDHINGQSVLGKGRSLNNVSEHKFQAHIFDANVHELNVVKIVWYAQP